MAQTESDQGLVPGSTNLFVLILHRTFQYRYKHFKVHYLYESSKERENHTKNPIKIQGMFDIKSIPFGCLLYQNINTMYLLL